MTRSLLALLLGCLLSLQLATAAPLLPTAGKSTEPAEPVVQGGLLGAIADGLDDVSQELDVDNHLIDNWRLRADRAADEVDQLVSQPSGLSSLELWTDFALLTITWLLAFALLTNGGRLLAGKSSHSRLLRERPRYSRVIKYLLVYTLPALASLIITLYVSHFLVLSAGRALGMSLAYATSSGIFSTSIIFCLITLFDTGHKRTAVRIIRRVAPRPLFLIGFLAAWSDALTSPQIARYLGGNITSSVAAVTGLLATLAFAVLVLRLRRPVAHLIRNRALPDRLQHRAVQETLRIFSALWFLPILMMILVSAIHLIGAGEESQRALQKALLTSILLIGTVFLSTVFQHMFKHQEQEDARQRLRPYKELLRNLARALLRIAIAVAFIVLLGRIWGFSVLDFALRNSLGRAISDSLSSIGLILLVTWLLWVVIDTAIQEALKPTVGRRAARQPSTRVRTILPMLRNAIKIILVVICTITTMANLGINVAPLLAGAGVVGLAIGFGSQQLVQDVITGLFILIEDTIAIGDWVVLDSGHAGTVESLTIRTLRLRDGKGFVHSVPFGQIKAVTNQSRQFAYAFFSVQFSYETDIDSALKLIREVGHSISEDPMLRHSLQGPLQVFGVDSMNLNGITLTAQFRTTSGGQYAVNRAFNERLKKRVDQTDDVSFAQYNPPPSRVSDGHA
ncbi:mechanosensitive ion channel family protein [Pseudomonas putida]|uniref:mechanosensitive ion channel family protein n=1 Tax=Pseudomonas putida TaxID=303 RepID=UPI0023673227|nr:mechanosensitive ion channel family protein [Pseudomonas putida]MDD2049733.1 mechanosensitive ion channel family protein [Pseudomonas putida]